MVECSNFGGQWCTLEEERFLKLLEEDLTGFLNRGKFNRVLLFPPLSSKLRFILHKVVESYPTLGSHSVGKEPNRRAAVYFVKKSLKRNDQSLSTGTCTSQKMPLKSLNQSNSRERGKERGRGRGRGYERAGEISRLGNNLSLVTDTSKECSIPKNSPSSSQRPTQKLYQPGAFRKLKRENEPSANETGATAVEFSCGVNLNANEKTEIKSSLQKSSFTTQPPNIKETLTNVNKKELLSHSRVDGEDWGMHEDPGGSQVDPMSSQIDLVGTHKDLVDTQVDPACAQVKPVGTQVDPGGNQVDPGGNQVDPASDQGESVVTQVEPVVTQVDPVGTQVDPASAQGEPVVTQVDPVGTQVDPASAQGEPVVTQVDPVSTQVDPVSTSVDPVSTQVDPVSTSVDPVTTSVDPVSTQVDPVSTSMDQVDPLEELNQGLVAENFIDNDRTKHCPSSSGSDIKDRNFVGVACSVEGTEAKEKFETNCHQGLASKIDATSHVKDLSGNKLIGQEGGTTDGDTQVDNRTKQKSKRQCKKEEKAKKKEGKLKKKSKVLQKSDTAHVKKDVKSACSDKISVKETTEMQHSEGKEVARMEEKEEKKEEEDGDWDANWGEDGECINSEMLAELSEAVDVPDVEVEKPKFDYLSFKPKDIILDNGAFDHVVELYDFPPELKTQDLVHALSRFKSQDFEIRWVDDSHALAVFSSYITAQSAVEQCSSPLLKLRPLYEGTQQSKLSAKKKVEFLRPYKERPKTSNLVANRLVSGALGVRSKMSKEERQLEREKIKAEREKKLKKEKQKKDLWESEDLDN